MDQLEAILRDVAEELASWRTRAQKAEGELKKGGGAGGGGERAAVSAKPDPAVEAENKALRQRLESARVRVADLLQRITFLEEQARDAASGNGGARAASGGAS